MDQTGTKKVVQTLYKCDNRVLCIVSHKFRAIRCGNQIKIDEIMLIAKKYFLGSPIIRIFARFFGFIFTKKKYISAHLARIFVKLEINHTYYGVLLRAYVQYRSFFVLFIPGLYFFSNVRFIVSSRTVVRQKK